MLQLLWLQVMVQHDDQQKQEHVGLVKLTQAAADHLSQAHQCATVGKMLVVAVHLQKMAHKYHIRGRQLHESEGSTVLVDTCLALQLSTAG